MRRLRRERRSSLYDLARETGLSYSHLSRIENDGTLPNPDTVVRIAEALGADLTVMLEKAQCLPAVILERIKAVNSGASTPALLRSVSQRSRDRAGADPGMTLRAIVGEAGVAEDELVEIAQTVRRLARLEPHQRSSIMGLVQSISVERDDGDGRCPPPRSRESASQRCSTC